MGDFITLRVSIPSNKSAWTEIGWLSSVNPEADTEKGAIDQLHVVGIYHFLKDPNFPEFLGNVI